MHQRMGHNPAGEQSGSGDFDVATDNPAKTLQPFAECRDLTLSFRIVLTPHPYYDLPHAHRLLRVHREWPNG